MGWAGCPGRATWVLAAGLLAAALALPAGPGARGWLPAGPGPLGAQAPPGSPGAGPEWTAQVRRARPGFGGASGGSAASPPAAGGPSESGE